MVLFCSVPGLYVFQSFGWQASVLLFFCTCALLLCGGKQLRPAGLPTKQALNMLCGLAVRLQISVLCNGTRGVFYLSDMKINCLCSTCEAAPQNKRIFTPTQFEQHGGCGTAKKWRISIR
jgi:predicted small integral membrane protein